MKKIRLILLMSLYLGMFSTISAQVDKKDKKFSFYGGFGLSLSTGYTYISLQPGILYHVHPKMRLGAGVQYTYLKSNKSYYGVNYKYNIYGFNTLALYYPVKGLEISAEFEDLYVKQDYNDIENNFWSPALFGGVGYHYGPVVAGFKFNFLYDAEKSIYQDAFIPFVRIYFN